MTERRLIALDELRGLAITAVIISHVALVYRDDSTIAFGLAMPALGVGVDLFFVISGFVIFQNATRMIARAPTNFWRGADAFWIRRAIRIALPAWATVAAIAAMQGASGADGASLSDLAAAAGFYADFHWGNCWAGVTSCGDALVASHFWSLAVEMQFYALAPLLVLLPPRALTLSRAGAPGARRGLFPSRGPVLVGGPARRFDRRRDVGEPGRATRGLARQASSRLLRRSPPIGWSSPRSWRGCCRTAAPALGWSR